MRVWTAMKHRWIGGVLVAATLVLAGCRQDAGGPASSEPTVPPASVESAPSTAPTDSAASAAPSGTPAPTPEDYDY